VTVFAPIVSLNERAKWEAYSNENPWWVNMPSDSGSSTPEKVSEFVFHLNNGNQELENVTQDDKKVFAPIWQSSPKHMSFINQDLLADTDVYNLYSAVVETHRTVLSGISSIGQHLFGFATSLDESEADTVNRKATIVIEHLVQASDVCHTMLHWHVYRKWNECLFMEKSKAYADGRAIINPSDTWFKGEMGFFDFYIIPLAKKLADCQVFGVSSDESWIMQLKTETNGKPEGKMSFVRWWCDSKCHCDHPEDRISNNRKVFIKTSSYRYR
jgi:3'5'-cyclic nucleotide phosphodiesterase